MSYQTDQDEELALWIKAFANVGRLQGEYTNPEDRAQATWKISGIGRPAHRAQRTNGAWKSNLRAKMFTHGSRSRSECNAKSRSQNQATQYKRLRSENDPTGIKTKVRIQILVTPGPWRSGCTEHSTHTLLLPNVSRYPWSAPACIGRRRRDMEVG